MLDETGARLQENMRQNPAMQRIGNIDRLMRGTITNVRYQDAPGKPRITVVDVFMSGFPPLTNVPVMSSKINYDNGEEWTPDPGDGVLVAFVNGNYGEPVVLGYFPTVDNSVQAKTVDVPSGKRRYHRRCNKTDLKIDKDGNQIEVIQGYEDVTIVTGNWTVDVKEGKCTVHVKGKTVWQSEATVEIDGTNTGAVKGIVQGDCICALTGKPHQHISASVKASK